MEKITKSIFLALCLIALAAAVIAEWQSIPGDSARTIIAPDSLGAEPYDSVSALTDTSGCGLIRISGEIHWSDGIPILLREVGYCVPPDSTRRFFAQCPEKERWFEWREE